MAGSFNIRNVYELAGLGQTSQLDAALAPVVASLRSKIVDIAAPAAKQAAEAAVPVIREELKRHVPTFALIVGAAIGLSMLIGTQLPRWNIGGR